jgi:polyhydroxyalkanoate synthesis regulator phasin
VSGNFSAASFSGDPGGFSVDRVSTGGGLDGGIVKPTGLLYRKEARKDVEDRVEETREIHEEIAEKLARELREGLDDVPTQELSLVEIDQEIGRLLRKALRTEEEEILLLLLMIA